MSREQTNTLESSNSTSNIPADLLANSLPARTGPYRSLSAKRPRDPSHRKSVSFNDVPIVHEVPSHDSMRNANCTTFRSWTYTDTTPTSQTIPSFYSSQLIPPFNSTSAAAQKIHANRLSSSLYSSLSTNTTASRIPDWALRAKTAKPATNTEETPTSTLTPTSTTINTNTTTTNEANTSTWIPPVIIVHTPDEKTSTKDISPKSTLHSTYSNPYIISTPIVPPAPPPAPHSSLALNTSDNHDEKKHPYRAAIIPETENHRTLPFTYEPVSDSTATYTSMLSTNIIAANSHTSNNSETTTSPYPRTARARSATLPLSLTQHMTRGTESISITPFRSPTSVAIQNPSPMPSRTVLRPTTIAFQCAQPSSNSNLSSGTTSVTQTINNGSINATFSSNITTTPKPPVVPQRFASSAAAVAAAHSRYGLSSSRTLPNSSLVTSTIKYAFAHPTLETTFNPTVTTSAGTTTTTTPTMGMAGTGSNSMGTTPTRPPPTAYPRSRSANVIGTRRHASAIENHHTHSSTTNPNNSLYSTSKRNPNVRQNYGSYYMHRVLLPTTIN